MIYILSIIGLNLLVFWRAFFYKYVIDDYTVAKCVCKDPAFYNKKENDGSITIECLKCHFKKQDRFAKNIWQNLWWHFIGEQYTNSFLAHSFAFTIHAINCILIYLVLGHNECAYYTALLFAVNPVTTQGGVWLSGKGYGMTTMMVLLMVGLKWIAPVFYWLTYSFAVSGILSPLLFIRSGLWFWIILIPVCFYVKWKWFKNALEYKYNSATDYQKKFKPANLILIFKTLGYYFCLCLMPTRLGVHHTYLYTYGLTKEESDYWLRLDKFFWIGIALGYILFTNFFWNYNLSVFGLIWFFIFIMQWCNLITVQQSIAERYAYLPAIGVMYMLVNTFLQYGKRGEEVLLAFFVYYVTRTSLHLPSYKDLLTAAQYNILNFPDSHAGWTWRGTIEYMYHRKFMAFESWLTGWKIRPNDFRLCNNLACLCTDMGLIEEAEKYIQLAASIPMQGREKEQDYFCKSELNRINAVKQARKFNMDKQAGRNDPCPCGSGKKYKKCCGR